MHTLLTAAYNGSQKLEFAALGVAAPGVGEDCAILTNYDVQGIVRRGFSTRTRCNLRRVNTSSCSRDILRGVLQLAK